MLVLTRYADESILIGDDTELTVVEVSNRQVRFNVSSRRSGFVHQEATLSADESVRIDDDIEVMIVEVRNERARIGYRTPADRRRAQEVWQGP
jgi:carbon storage regulator CsrA